jgi:hypothetical protein
MSEAAAAANEQGLPVLAAPPRSVPLRAQWQLLRGNLRMFLVMGAFFTAIGILFTSVLVLDWPHESHEELLAFAILAVVFPTVGGAMAGLSLRHWRRTVTILRRGHLAKCRITKCKHPRSGTWTPYETLLEEFRGAWDKPIADFNTTADTRNMQRFATLFGWFAALVFGFMGIVGVIITGVVIYMAIAQREPIAWFGMLFLAVWWTMIVWLGKTFRRQVGLVKNIGKQSLKSLGINPLVDCRAQLMLPDGKPMEFDTAIDISARLSGRADESDIAVYDPYDPSRALLCSSFGPPLKVSESGRWRFDY